MYMDSALILEDGSVFQGKSFGYPCEASGEVVFNTGMVGYTEALTDPSYYGQILVQTYPLIGNYGVPSYNIKDETGIPLHFESDKIQIKGYVVSSLSRHPSHWSSVMSLDDWMTNEKIPGIIIFDTRELTKKLRNKGTMLGVIKRINILNNEELLSSVKDFEDPNLKNLPSQVSPKKAVEYKPLTSETGLRVVVIDCGVKYGILRNISMRGATTIRVPYNLSTDEILSYEPSGILISNGPGDPKQCTETIEAVKGLMETDIPIFGICLGLQLLSLAADVDTFKLSFGHRGQNHPSIDLRSKRCFITSQNHGYATEIGGLKESDFACSMVNANDQTVEGIVHNTKKIFAVQFHPEGSPGPYETGFLFDRFFDHMEGG